MSKAIYKNVFLFVLLTRIIRKEIELKKGLFTRDKLFLGVDEKPMISTRTLADYLTENIYKVKLYTTAKTTTSEDTLKVLFSLVSSSLIGKKWDEFEQLERERLGFQPEIAAIVKQFDDLKESVDIVFKGEPPHEKTLGFLGASSKHRNLSSSTKLLLTNALEKFQDYIALRIKQIYVVETVIDGLKFNSDEIIFIRFFQTIPLELLPFIKLEFFSRATKFYVEIFTPALIIKSLFEKQIIGLDAKGKFKWNIDYLKISLPDIEYDFTFLNNLTAERLKQRFSLRWTSIYFLQKTGKWEEASKIFIKKEKFKKRGLLDLYILVLNQQLSSEHFKSLITNQPEQLWLYWALAQSLVSVGKPHETTLAINNLFTGIKNFYNKGKKIDNKGIEILMKAFQLCLDILLNYENRTVLLKQADAFNLLVLIYLNNKRAFHRISTITRCQLATTIARYFFNIGDTDFAFRLMTKAHENFILRSNKSTIASINLALIDVSPPSVSISKKIMLANTARQMFIKRKNLLGAANAELYSVYLNLLNGGRDGEKLLPDLISVFQKSGGYDEQVLKILEQIILLIDKKEILSIINSEIVRLKSIKHGFSKYRYQHLDLTLLLVDFNFDDNDVLPVLTLNDIKEHILSILSPLHERDGTLKNPEPQSIISGSFGVKVRYLKNVYTLSGKNKLDFYQNDLNRAVLTGKWSELEVRVILQHYFTMKNIRVISKLPDVKYRLDYCRFLINKKKLKSAKIILDSCDSSEKLPEYYNLMGNYLKVSHGKKNRNKIIQSYKNAIRLAEFEILKCEETRIKQKLMKDLGRYYNNMAFSIIEARFYNHLSKAKDCFIKSIEIMGGYSIFPHPYIGLALCCLIESYKQPENEKSDIKNCLSKFGISSYDIEQVEAKALEEYSRLYPIKKQ